MLSRGLLTETESRTDRLDSRIKNAHRGTIGRMAFRSHVLRPIDLSISSNRLIVGLGAVGVIAAAAVVLAGGPASAWWTPVYIALMWALGREIDPDHEATALIAAVGGGLWVLAGFDASAMTALLGLMFAARLTVNSTGRRPLLTDYIVMGAMAAAISFTITGWVGGFGIALAIYIDDRMAGEHRQMSAFAAALTALAASVVVTAARAFPQEVPDARSAVVLAIGFVALVAVVREPEPPVSLVDSRMKSLLVPGRLHAARAMVGVLVFLGAFLNGADAVAMIPAAGVVALALASNEVERIRRRSG